MVGETSKSWFSFQRIVFERQLPKVPPFILHWSACPARVILCVQAWKRHHGI